jgi:hypothetical protein
MWWLWRFDRGTVGQDGNQHHQGVDSKRGVRVHVGKGVVQVSQASRSMRTAQTPAGDAAMVMDVRTWVGIEGKEYGKRTGGIQGSGGLGMVDV